MNWDQVEGKWKEFKGKIQERWGELTDDELDQAKGNRQQIEGLIQQKYGKTKEQVREELDRWMREDA